MREKSRNHEIHEEEWGEEDPLVQEARAEKERVKNALRNKPPVLQRRFLKKYASDSILEAVKKADSAAVELVEYVRRFKKFGNLDQFQLREAVLAAIDSSHDAALAFVQGAQHFLGILKQEGMEDALYRATNANPDCLSYVLEHLDEGFGDLLESAKSYNLLKNLDRVRKQKN
jgi:hypothetical protein